MQGLQPLAAAARGHRAAGRGLPSIEPGMPLPAGTGMDRRSFLLRSRGRGARRSTAPRALAPRSLRRGHRRGRGRATPNQPVLVSIFMEGGWDALSVLAPVRKPRYHELRPTLGQQRRRRRAVHRGRNADVAPAGGRPRAAARRGQGRGVPGDRLRPARREPLHEPPLLGGRRTQHAGALGLDGALPRRRGQPRQPAAGTVARLLAGAGARHHARAGRRRVLALRLQLLGLRPGRTADRGRRWKTFGALGSLGAPSPAFAQARTASLRTRTSSARRSRRSPNTKANPASPRPSPTRPSAASSRSAWRCSRR